MIAAGLVDRSGDGAVTATEGGRVVLGAMYDGLAAAASGLWATQAARLTRLSEMAGRVVDAAMSSGGEAYATVAPPIEPPVGFGNIRGNDETPPTGAPAFR